MKSILETCSPRPDILAGTFNPEIFTASLGQVLETYRGGEGIIHNLYTDGEQFFKEATYPTEGLKLVLSDVFGRLNGDNSLPATHRLETSFGGGKTHTLIALTHIGVRGKELADVTANILENKFLPNPGEVSVVGIAGDDIPVHKPEGKKLLPYTLWGEIAFQVGGEELYKEVETDVTSYAAPGKEYFERVFTGRKVLLMLDELAQYAARLEAAKPDGAEQLAAFLMRLHGHARTHSGIAVVITLASATDAFARQTDTLKDLLTKVTGAEVSKDDAQGIAEKAQKGIQSVIARDATPVVPVQHTEISRVLAKRLFIHIEDNAPTAAADEYREMYERSASALPESVLQEKYRKDMVDHYPFHPSLLAYLNNKMSTIENFQGTRGVLRVLALALRTIWEKRVSAPMIHTCHLDMRDARTVAEIISRTGSGDLLTVLNADVGGVDTAMLEAGQSNAGLLDKSNPHPMGFPLYEYTWKTVFLHSLVARGEQLGSNIFGITEKEALLDVSFPGMTPPQVETALKAIEKNAYYLRFKQGRFFASLDPSINLVLVKIRGSLRKEQHEDKIKATARKVVRADVGIFEVQHDVSAPEHIPDKRNKPVLALVDPYAAEIDCEEFVTTVGQNRAREYQNMVFILTPATCHCKGETWSEAKADRASQMRGRIEEVAQDVIARGILKEKPENYGVTTAMLAEDGFDAKLRERDNALVTTVTQLYDGLWFSSSTGQVIRKEIKTGGGEGGASVIEEIKRVLLVEGELITTENATSQEGLISLQRLFFTNNEVPTVESIRKNFLCSRKWPVLDSPDVLDQAVRAGVTKGVWCLFKFENPESIKPEKFFSRDTGEVPFDLDLTDPKWSLVSVQGSNQRGWSGAVKVDPTKVQQWVSTTIKEKGATYVSDIVAKVKEQHGDVPDQSIMDAVKVLATSDRVMTFEGRAEQTEKPTNLVHGGSAILHEVKPTHVVIVPSKAAERGWVAPKRNEFKLEGTENAAKLMPLLSNLGNLYVKGATSTIKTLDLVDLSLKGGGKMRLSLEDVPPASMKRLAEFFEVFAGVVEKGDTPDLYLEISEPDDNCLLIKELKK